MDVQRRTLWFRWVVANALGELIGLGATFAVGFATFSLLGEAQGTIGAIAMLLLFTASGAIVLQVDAQPLGPRRVERVLGVDSPNGGQ